MIAKVIVIIALAACARPQSTKGVMSQSLETQQHVRDVIASLVHSLDGRRWNELPALFSDEVETDYTSLNGGEVQRQAPSALVGSWNKMLSPLDATQHHLGPIAVTIDGDRATAHCHVRGYHVREGAPGGVEWVVAGHYVFEMTRASSGWKIRKLTLETSYQSGNRKLVEEAAAMNK